MVESLSTKPKLPGAVLGSLHTSVYIGNEDNKSQNSTIINFWRLFILLFMIYMCFRLFHILR